MKPCLDCGTPTTGSRCAIHARAYDRARRPSGGIRYGRMYQRNRAAILAGNPVCAICRVRRAVTADHIVPINKGGTHRLDNLQPACFTCNSGKGDRDDTGRLARVDHGFGIRRVDPRGDRGYGG